MNRETTVSCQFCFDNKATHILKWVSYVTGQDGHRLLALLCNQCLTTESEGIRRSTGEDLLSHRPL